MGLKMTIPPIGYNANLFAPLAHGSAAGQVGAATPPDKPDLNPKPCQTCANRRYVDRSNDSSVSFQTPTKLAPGEAALAVMAHEQEHVAHNAERASGGHGCPFYGDDFLRDLPGMRTHLCSGW